MDHRTLVLVSLTAVLLSVGAPNAEAYLDPCQVFGGCDDGTEDPHGAASSVPFDRTDPTTHAAPPTMRDGEGAVGLQQHWSQIRREEEQRAAFASSSSMHGSAPVVEPNDPIGLFTDDYEYETRQDRLAEKNSNGVTIVFGSNGSVTQNGTVLHSGAPYVSATGPETILTLLALILATASTLAYVRMRAKRMA